MKKNQLKPLHDKIVSMYVDQKMTAFQIAVVIGCSSGGVLRVLKKMGIQTRSKTHYGTKYALRPDVFKCVDTEEKAYFLGFLYADGYHNEKTHAVVWTIQERDTYILEAFNRCLGSNRPISVVEMRGVMKQKQGALRVVNVELSKHLTRLGLTQAKSLTLKFPTSDQVPDHLLHHFIRGYFDGDGCISLCRNDPRYPTLVMCVSRSFGEDLKCVMDQHGVRLKFKKRQSRIDNLQVCGRLACLRFLDFVYHGASIFLTRKREKYEIMSAYVSPKTPKLSVYYGVSPVGKRWKASCRTSGIQHYLGLFPTEMDAAKKCDQFVKSRGLDKPINFPEEETSAHPLHP